MEDLCARFRATRKRKRPTKSAIPVGGDQPDDNEEFAGPTWKLKAHSLRRRIAKPQHQAQQCDPPPARPKATPRSRKPKEPKTPKEVPQAEEPKDSDERKDTGEAMDTDEAKYAEEPLSSEKPKAPSERTPAARARRGSRAPRVRKPKPPKPPKPPLPPRPRLKHSEIPLARTIFKGLPKRLNAPVNKAQPKRTPLLNFKKDMPAKQDVPVAATPSVPIGDAHSGQLPAIGLNLGDITKTQPQQPRTSNLFRRNNTLGKHWNRLGGIK